MEIFRQGDILIIRVEAKPKRERAGRIDRDGGRVVLAYGEVTGHAHAISDAGALLYALKGSNDRLLTLQRPSTLRHEEHAPINLKPGSYVVRRQREYSPEEVRYVAD